MKYSKTLILKLALYLVLIACGFILLIFSARQYEESVSTNENNEDIIVCLSYLKTKVMMAENVDIISYRNKQMLYIDHKNYDIYIFYNEGSINEINVVNDYRFDLSEADSIMDIDNLEIEESDDYITFIATNSADTERLLVKK